MVEQESLKQLIDPLFRFGDIQSRLIEIMLRRCLIYESPTLIYKIMSNINKHELDCLLYNFKNNISSVFELIYNPTISKRSRKNWLQVVILFVKKFDLTLPAHHELILHILKVSTHPDSKRSKNYQEIEYNERLNWILLMKVFRRVSKNKILMQKIYSNFELKKQEVDEINSYAYTEDYFTTVAHLRLFLLVSLLYQTFHGNGNVTSTPKAKQFSMLKFPTSVQQNQQQIPSAMNLSQQLYSQYSQSIFNHQSSLTQNHMLNQNQQQIANPQIQNQFESNNPQQLQIQGSLTPNNNGNANVKINNNINWIALNNNSKQADNLSCHSLINNQSFVFNVNQNQSPLQTAIKPQNTYNGSNFYGNQLNENGKASFKLIQLNKNDPIKITDKKVIENFFQKSVLLKCDRQKQNHYDWMFSSEWFLVQFWMPQLCSSDDLLKKQVSQNKNLNPQLFFWIQKNLHMLVQEIHEFLFLSKFKIFNNNYKELLKKVTLSFLFENQNQINYQDQINSLETLQAPNQSSSPKQNSLISSIASASMHRMRQNIQKINKQFKQILSVDISKLPETYFANYLSYDWRSNTVKPSGDFPQYDPGIFYKEHSKNKIFNIIESLNFQSNCSNSLDQSQQIDLLLGNMKALTTVSKVLESIFSIEFVQILLNKQLIQQQFIIPIMRTVSLILQYSPITNQILFHESVDKLINLLDTTNEITLQLKKQIQQKLQKTKRTRKEEKLDSISQTQDNNLNFGQDDQQVLDQNPSLFSQPMKNQQNMKTLINNNQQNQNQINYSKTSSINSVQNSIQEKARQAQRQILEEFKKRQQSFCQQNQIKETKKLDQANNKQPLDELENLICNICSESYIKYRIFYINCYIQLDNYYKSYKGLKADIKQQHNFYLTTCNHLMHKDCIIQHIRSSNQYESLLQENEYFCQCCFRLNNIFVPYLEQYERTVCFQYNPLKQVFFIDEISHQQNQDDLSSEGDAQQIDNMDQGIITSQLPKNPQLPFPLDQIDQKNIKSKQIVQQGKKKSHAVGFFNFSNNQEDSSFMQIIQQIEATNDKNGFVNENSPQKLLDKNSDFQKFEKDSRQELEVEKSKYKIFKKQIEDIQRKTESNNNDVVAEDVIFQGNSYLLKKKHENFIHKKGLNKNGIIQLKCHTQKQSQQNENQHIQMKGEAVKFPQFKNNQQETIVEEKKESSIQEEDRVLTDYFEPEVDISYLEDMNLRLQHIDIKYNNILVCFQSLLINQIEESMTNTNEVQDYNMLKESFIKSKQFNVSRNLFLYLKVWSFIEDRDSIHEAYYLSQKELIQDIQYNDFYIYEVSLGKKSNFASILVNLMILFLNKEEAFLSLSAKFIYKYLIFDIIIEKAKNFKDLDIIPDPQNFSSEICENLLKNFKELIDYRFLQITYCVWLIYYGKKNQKSIEIFLNSMISSSNQNEIQQQDSQFNECTFNILTINQNQKSNILLPENTIIDRSQDSKFKVSAIKNYNNIVDVAQNLLNQQILDDLFYVSINKKISQFNNYKQFQLQLTLNLQVSYSDFIQCHFFGKCSICRRYPHNNQEGYFMCLICNSNLCAKHLVNPTNKKSTNQQNSQQQKAELKKQFSNTLIEHTKQHHSGMSMYLNYSSSQVVIVRDSEIYIQRQLLLYKDQIGRPPNVNKDWKNQVQICNNTQKELQDLINKKDFDQKCMQIKRILFDQQLDQQELQMRRMLMNNDNVNNVDANNQIGVQNRQNSNQQRQARQQERRVNNQIPNQQQDGLSLNQQQDTQTLDLNQQDRIANTIAASNQNSQNLNQQGAAQNINSNNNINNNQLYTNQQNFSSNVFTTLNF
ncbi:hypothetical protein ABPG74_014803 [Tetrahymena malaccensis]